MPVIFLTIFGYLMVFKNKKKDSGLAGEVYVGESF